MYLVFDYRCPCCGLEEERMVDKTTKDNQRCYEYHDNDVYPKMTRLPPSPPGYVK